MLILPERETFIFIFKVWEVDSNKAFHFFLVIFPPRQDIHPVSIDKLYVSISGWTRNWFESKNNYAIESLRFFRILLHQTRSSLDRFSHSLWYYGSRGVVSTSQSSFLLGTIRASFSFLFPLFFFFFFLLFLFFFSARTPSLSVPFSHSPAKGRPFPRSSTCTVHPGVLHDEQSTSYLSAGTSRKKTFLRLGTSTADIRKRTSSWSILDIQSKQLPKSRLSA